MMGKKEPKFKELDEEITAFLGRGTEFEGKLIFEGSVRIDGVFNGQIYTKGTLVIGETAKIRAEIDAKSLIISGEVYGDLKASQRVEIHAPGKLYGNINTPVLVIEEGVIFEGNCKMTTEEEKEEALEVAEPIAKLPSEEEEEEGEIPTSPADSIKIR